MMIRVTNPNPKEPRGNPHSNSPLRFVIHTLKTIQMDPVTEISTRDKRWEHTFGGGLFTKRNKRITKKDPVLKKRINSRRPHI